GTKTSQDRLGQTANCGCYQTAVRYVSRTAGNRPTLEALVSVRPCRRGFHDSSKRHGKLSAISPTRVAEPTFPDDCLYGAHLCVQACTRFEQTQNPESLDNRRPPMSRPTWLRQRRRWENEHARLRARPQRQRQQTKRASVRVGI